MSASSNVTSGFIDLATFDEIEKYMYGGPDATAYFVRETRKSTWFTQVPVVLSKASGSPGFAQDWSVSISRAGDYLLQTWLRLTTPVVTLTSASAANSGTVGVARSLRWTRNLMHNIIKECSITFNDLVAARFDNYHLDFWAAFTVPASKRNGYDNMVGNVSDLTDPHVGGTAIPSYTLNLPLPFFYGRDSGVALPTAALPYNEMRINFSFRDFTDLLILSYDDEETNSVPVTATDLVQGAPSLTAQVWANYAIVSNDERKRMACAPRDILVEQVQTAPRYTFSPGTSTSQSFDIRFSHAIKVLFFAVRNTSCKSEWSIYSTSSPTVAASGSGPLITFFPDLAADPIVQTSLIYENTNRLTQMGSDYFSLINPWYHAPTIPDIIGFHSYSYSLDFMALDPMGSTNYGKLTNVSIVPEASPRAVLAAAGNGATGSGYHESQTFEFVVTCINNNIIRVSGGKLPSVPPTVSCYKRCDNSFVGKQCKLSPEILC